MNELDELIRKMIEYFNSVEEKLVCVFSLYYTCTLLYFTDFEESPVLLMNLSEL